MIGCGEAQDFRRFELLTGRIAGGGRLLRACALQGGVSAKVTVLEVLLPGGGQVRKFVVRQHGDEDLRRNANVAADEFRLLRILAGAGVPVPVPVHLEQAGDLFPAPCLVVEYIEGSPQFQPADQGGFLRQMAMHLHAIHSVDERGRLGFLPRVDERAGRCLAAMSGASGRADLDAETETRARELLATGWHASSSSLMRDRMALLHGDFWPGNLLWRGNQLVGIIDWEDAELGDPLADLANARLELAWALGSEASDSFTQLYASMAAIDLGGLPYWDLFAAMHAVPRVAGWGLEAGAEARMRQGLRAFIGRAFDRIAKV